jgi:hypothetical protein
LTDLRTSNYQARFVSKGDQCTFALVLCDGKTVENYNWFFQGCLDRGLSLDVAMFCIEHICSGAGRARGGSVALFGMVVWTGVYLCLDLRGLVRWST